MSGSPSPTHSSPQITYDPLAAQQAGGGGRKFLDVQTRTLCSKLGSSLVKTVQAVYQDPTLAHHRIGVHIGKSATLFVQKGAEVAQIQHQLSEGAVDVRYATEAVEDYFSKNVFSETTALINEAVAAMNAKAPPSGVGIAVPAPSRAVGNASIASNLL